jgi:hypothetical protein
MDYQTYDNIVQLLKCILEPAPLNQLGLPYYYRQILAALSQVKQIIENMESHYAQQLKSWENNIDEEF